MKESNVIALLLSALVLSLVGCEAAQNFLSGMDKPGFSLQNARITDLNMQEAELTFDVGIKNPYPVPLPLADTGYQLSTGGQQIVAGDAKLSGTVPANGTKVVQVPVRVGFDRLLSVVSGVKPGQVLPYTAKFNLKADPTGYAPLSQEISHEGELPVPAMPEVSLSSMQISDLSLTNVQADVAMDVRNTNAFKIGLQQVQYALSLAGAKVGEARLDQAADLAPGESTTMRFPLNFSPMSLGTSVYHVLTGQQAGYSLAGQIQADTPFGPLTLPYERSGQVPLMK